MSTFLDGPVAGTSLLFGRAPVFLRVVRSPAGKVDVLDQLDDEPNAGEEVFVYQRQGEAGHACVRHGKGRGCYAIGTYVHVPDAPVEQLRDTLAWRAWVVEQVPA